MAAEDFEIRGQRVNRVMMAKDVLEKFIAKRPSDRIGLVGAEFGTWVGASVHDVGQVVATA